ncbi:putative Cytochrome P450 71A26 [Cocos nucifera]|uniref:Putative Cytochrome P450 71A26 n=1 Tax=Cocos nucifera TaxID=13894 RepID=A0A8K0HXR8_COCNU|nr:putative Cytochrome P450 71A26 [Cocos nucifera]
MRTHDHIFAFRPSLKAAKILLYDSMDLAFAPYGEYWRQLRKLCTLHLLSAQRVRSFELVRQEEVASMLQKISRAAMSTGMVDMSEVLYFFTNDVLCRVVSGKFYRREGRNELFRELIERNSSLFGRFYVGDYFPFLAWMDSFLGLSRKARRNFERWDGLLDEKDPNRDFAIREEHMKALLVVSCRVQSFFYILVLFLRLGW